VEYRPQLSQRAEIKRKESENVCKSYTQEKGPEKGHKLVLNHNNF